jgi:hypothetical protein
MTTDELIAALQSWEVDGQYEIDGFYSHGRPLADGGLYVHHDGDRWEVGVYERGEDRSMATFDSEQEACDYAYAELTRLRPAPRVLTPDEEEASQRTTAASVTDLRERIRAAKAEHDARQSSDPTSEP